MRWVTRVAAVTGILAAIAAPIMMASPAQADRGGFGGFHGGGFHGGGFHGGGFHGGGFHGGGFHGGFHPGFRHRGFGGFWPGFGIGAGLGVLGGYPYYAYPPAYYPPPPPPAYSYPYYSYPPYGASSGGPQYASSAGYDVAPERKTVVREVIRVPYPVYVKPRHHRVVHKSHCNCAPSQWKQPKPTTQPS